MEPFQQLDELDRKILKLITQNAKIPFLEIARECGVSGAAIHQRINRLHSIGVIKGSEYLLDPIAMGYKTCAFMGIFLKKASLFDEVVKLLEEIPEVVECHYTTGQYAIFIKIYAKSNEHLKRILHDRLQSIEGISSTETIISLDETFKRQLPVE